MLELRTLCIRFAVIPWLVRSWSMFWQCTFYMVSFTWNRAQFTPAFISGFVESSFTTEFEVEPMYCYSVYDIS